MSMIISHYFALVIIDGKESAKSIRQSIYEGRKSKISARYGFSTPSAEARRYRLVVETTLRRPVAIPSMRASDVIPKTTH